MKYVKELTDGDGERLRDILKNSPSLKARIRANAILLSSKCVSIAVISDIFDVHRDTISNWLNNWEARGIEGLFDEPKPGRPKQICCEENISNCETVLQHTENLTESVK
ncbi:MAG: helix-turn-helix domain-containing protein [Ignavibacteriae bacterium]|nr:helix-turn-helix domain-containing protein [Ignavibacteriota bacterium]